MTLTFAGIARARLVLVTVAGAEKAAALAEVAGGDDLPAAAISGDRVVWLVDPAAASELPNVAGHVRLLSRRLAVGSAEPADVGRRAEEVGRSSSESPAPAASRFRHHADRRRAGRGTRPWQVGDRRLRPSGVEHRDGLGRLAHRSHEVAAVWLVGRRCERPTSDACHRWGAGRWPGRRSSVDELRRRDPRIGVPELGRGRAGRWRGRRRTGPGAGPRPGGGGRRLTAAVRAP